MFIFLVGPEVILLAGGFDGDSILDNVELYSPQGTCNFEIAPLPIRTYGLFCFVHDNDIFCCGGDTEPGNTCFRYLPDDDIGTWIIDGEKTLNHPRFFASVIKSPDTGVVFVR